MSEETKPGQDSSAAPDASGTGEGTTSTPDASRDAGKVKQLEDRLSAQGREVATLREQGTQLTAERDAAVATSTTDRTDIDAIRKEIREIKRAGIGDNAEAVKLFQLEEDLVARETAVRDKEGKLTAKETALTARETAAGATTLAATITRLANEHGITEKELVDLKITDADQLANVARTLAQRGKPRETKPGAREGEQPPGGDEGNPEPASLDGAGAASPTIEQMDKAPIADYFAARKKQDSTLI